MTIAAGPVWWRSVSLRLERRFQPFPEYLRFESAVDRARLLGAAAALVFAQFHPHVGAWAVGLLILLLLAYAKVFRAAPARLSSAELAALLFIGDHAVILFAMWVFAPDPHWATFMAAPLATIVACFRFGSAGAGTSAGLLAVGYVAIAAWREGTYPDLALPATAHAWHVVVYGLTAVVIGGVWREVSALLAEGRHAATHDRLTGLPNRALLEDRIDQALNGARRDGRSFGLLVVDLDGFKAVNDLWGHRAGDAVLQQVAQRLRHGVRAVDTVARVGGDEFAVLVTNAEAAAVTLLREKIRAITAEGEYAFEGRPVRVGASVGAAVYGGDAKTLESIMTAADAAMYGAKERRRAGGGTTSRIV